MLFVCILCPLVTAKGHEDELRNNGDQQQRGALNGRSSLRLDDVGNAKSAVSVRKKSCAVMSISIDMVLLLSYPRSFQRGKIDFLSDVTCEFPRSQ